MRRPTPAELRAALWTLRAGAVCRRSLAHGKVEDIDFPSAARIPVSGAAGVRAVLHMLRATCLTEALVTQAWRDDHGNRVDVVIGVTAPAAGFAAHAWLEEDPASHGAPSFEPIHRIRRSTTPG